ncbi:MAG: PSD1 domain-containing protein [Verrucomicrobia bacterium]|nr:PSD1 domain-containing protein [Verrucomicrobiota bacterium]
MLERVRILIGGVVGTALLLAAGPARAAVPSDRVDFNRHIRPILSDNCFACHGPDVKQRKADLRLDTKDGIFADLGGYAAVRPKDFKKSELWRRITTKDKDDVMPPPDSHKTLKPEQVAVIKRWIEQGAPYQEHWAFIAPKKPVVPATRNSKLETRNAIDAFIGAKLTEKKLTGSREASKEVLIRRVTFDLTGLPPTPAEVDEFLRDTKTDAYERLVERLMKRPSYGEHMARYWLDVARYGDTHGLHLDNERSMWPYRDWVVGAFNRNLPYDQFTVEQLAGDLLPKATRDQQIASGFNRCNVTTSEGGSIAEEFVVRYAVDRTQTAIEVWMGLTAGCAVCHDHKFDPLTQKEFYSLYAFFNSAADPAMDGNALLTAPILELTTPAEQTKLDDFDKKLTNVRRRMTNALAKVKYVEPATNAPSKLAETVWVDDAFPSGAKVQHKGKDTTWIKKADGPVFSGGRALKRTADKVEQDFYQDGATAFEVRSNGVLFAYVYLDPTNPPSAVMLQFHTTNWMNRAVWGDEDAIAFGKKGTTKRLRVGDLPESGKWVRLEVDAKKLGLRKSAKISGLAFTQFGGTVYWDKAGQAYETLPATDPLESQLAWEKLHQGKPDKELSKEVADIFRSVPPKERKPEHTRALRQFYLENVFNGTRTAMDPLLAELKPIKEQRDEFDKTITATFVMKDMEKPREAFVLFRGQYTQPRDKVTRNVPAVFPPLPRKNDYTRLDLAQWLVSPEHPLTARVAANRFWQQFFGTGLVKTAADFGSQGEPPSHPELLDWLAVTFRESGWDVKQLVKLIVTSATYRQDSKATPKLLDVDPNNRLLARGPRFRLDAEEIRDNALFVSGLLDPTMGGKGVRPYQPENIWEPVAYSGSNTKVYKQDSGSALYRRSLYTFLKRTAPPPAMTTLDGPSREQSCTRRERSNTPLQALMLMNDVQHFEAARAFAQRMMTEGGGSPDDRLAWAFRIATARQPAKNEVGILKQALDRQLARYRQNPDAAKQAIAFGESKPKAGLNESELAAYTLVANLILNLDETLTKN